MRQAEHKERLKRERLVEERYGQSLRQALLPLESESMLPVLVVTDMADRQCTHAVRAVVDMFGFSALAPVHPTIA